MRNSAPTLPGLTFETSVLGTKHALPDPASGSPRRGSRHPFELGKNPVWPGRCEPESARRMHEKPREPLYSTASRNTPSMRRTWESRWTFSQRPLFQARPRIRVGAPLAAA